MRQPGFSREIDQEALEAFLAFSFVPAPLSIFRDVRKLAPGSVLVWQAGQGSDVSIERYARPRPAPKSELRTEGEDELAEELRERLRDSVRAHLIADVPVGVLLSGGIDSCMLAALASEAAGQVSTFTIGFDEREFDERAWRGSSPSGSGPTTTSSSSAPTPPSSMPALAQAFDEPFADSSAIPTYLVSELARRHVKVALSGEGGDELFGGYNYYAGHALARRLAPAAWALRPLVERLPTSTDKASSLDWRAKRFVRAAGMSRARAPLRLEVRLHPRGARRPRPPGPASPRRPAGDPSRSLFGDGGLGRALAPDGPRPRPVHGRRHARQDGPGEHGALARGASADPRPGSGGARARTPEQAEGARAGQEATAAEGRRAPPSPRDPRRQEEGLRASDRHLVARGPAPVGDGCPVSGERSPAGLLPARGRHPATRRLMPTAARTTAARSGRC